MDDFELDHPPSIVRRHELHPRAIPISHANTPLQTPSKVAASSCEWETSSLRTERGKKASRPQLSEDEASKVCEEFEREKHGAIARGAHCSCNGKLR